MFEHTPDTWWWIAGANLTQWFYWPALSAIFSAGALSATIFLATRSDRERRDRQTVAVQTAVNSMTNVVFTARGALEHIEQGMGFEDAYAKAFAFMERTRTVEKVHEFPMKEFPNPQCLGAWMMALAVMADIENILQLNAINQTPEYLAGRRDVLEDLVNQVARHGKVSPG